VNLRLISIGGDYFSLIRISESSALPKRLVEQRLDVILVRESFFRRLAARQLDVILG
jgi:hypothetical protein